MQQRFTIRKILIGVLVLIPAIIGVKIAVYFLTTGQVTITAKGATHIFISPLSDPIKVHQEGGSDSFSLRLHAGDYAITATQHDTTTKQLVTVVARKTQHVDVTLQAIGSLEPVSPRYVTGFVADQSGLAYVDVNNTNFYSVGSDNIERLIDTPETLVNIKWADSQFGVGQGQSGNFYTINGTTVQALSIPSSSGKQPTSFVISKARQIYLTVDGKLYTSNAGGAFKTITTGSIDNPAVIAVSNNGNLLLESTIATKQGEDPLNILATLTNNGLSQKKSFAISHSAGFQVAWSPDGEKLLVGTPTGSMIDDPALNVLAKLPSNNIHSPVWINNHVIVYSSGSTVWAYDTMHRSSYALGVTYNQATISNVYSGNDGDSVYVNFPNNSSGQQISRLSLSKPQKNSGLQSLAIILPVTLEECSYGYVNFTHMSISAFGPTVSQSDCLQKITDYFKSYKAELGNEKLPVSFNPGT